MSIIGPWIVAVIITAAAAVTAEIDIAAVKVDVVVVSIDRNGTGRAVRPVLESRNIAGQSGRWYPTAIDRTLRCRAFDVASGLVRGWPRRITQLHRGVLVHSRGRIPFGLAAGRRFGRAIGAGNISGPGQGIFRSQILVASVGGIVKGSLIAIHRACLGSGIGRGAAYLGRCPQTLDRLIGPIGRLADRLDGLHGRRRRLRITTKGSAGVLGDRRSRRSADRGGDIRAGCIGSAFVGTIQAGSNTCGSCGGGFRRRRRKGITPDSRACTCGTI